jgi:predicted naringenin-chalcone synthase
MLIGSFRLVRPRYEARQEDILVWLADVHTRAAAAAAVASTRTNANPAADAPRAFDEAAFHERIKRLIRHVCCGSDKIATRGYSAPNTPTPGEPLLYDQATSPAGAGAAARTDWYAHEVESVFQRIYEGESEPPADLVHVTCTGYVSPSGAQRLVSNRKWGESTRVTHAYHMGCYAAVPALRIASGLARASGARADIVHTELCSLHFDPSQHTPEQLVVQSLFADGSVRYTLSFDGEGPGLHLLALHEVLSEDSEDAMQWRLGDFGMRMTLSREIPDRIGRSIRPFVSALFARAGLDFARERTACAFAVHPGGPKIIDAVRDALELDESQVAAGRRVLRRFGNMSSATLPHIWSDLLDDPTCVPGTLVASFGFGPGLTVCGALFRKE